MEKGNGEGQRGGRRVFSYIQDVGTVFKVCEEFIGQGNLVFHRNLYKIFSKVENSIVSREDLSDFLIESVVTIQICSFLNLSDIR